MLTSIQKPIPLQYLAIVEDDRTDKSPSATS